MADKLLTMAYGPVTRQDLRGELHSFAASSLKQSLLDIATVVRQEVRQELRALLLEKPSNLYQELQQQHQGKQARQWQQTLLVQQAQPEPMAVACLDNDAALRVPKDSTKDGDDVEENVELRPVAMAALVCARVSVEEQENPAGMVRWIFAFLLLLRGIRMSMRCQLTGGDVSSHGSARSIRAANNSVFVLHAMDQVISGWQ